MEEYLSITEAAKELGVTPTTLRRWDHSGKLRPVRIAGSTHRKYPQELITKIKNKKRLATRESPATAPKMLLTDKLIDIRSFIDNAAAFVRLLESLAINHEKMVDVQADDGPGDFGVDIRGYTVGRHNKKQDLVYIQSKFVQNFSKSESKAEANKVIENVAAGNLETPDKYIIGSTVNISAGQRAKLRTILKASFPNIRVVFWCPRELDAKIKSDPVTYDRFILKPFRALQNEVTEYSVPEDGKPLITGPSYDADESLTTSGHDKDEYTSFIERAVDFIKDGEIEEARALLLKTWGSVEKKNGHNTSKAKILSNLGVTYLPVGEYRDLSKAEKYFMQALEFKPDFEIAKSNLALSYVFAEQDDKAWKVVKDLQSVIAANEPRRLGIYLDLLSKKEGLEKALNTYEEVTKSASSELLDSEDLRRQVGFLYLKNRDHDKADELIDINLKNDPEDPFSLYLKAVIVLDKAGESAGLFRLILTPGFKDPAALQRCVDLLQKAYKNAKVNKVAKGLLPQILYNLQLCKLALERYYNIHIEFPDQEALETALSLDPGLSFQDFIQQKKFVEAYQEYKKLEENYDQITLDQLERIAEIFLYHGSPQYAVKVQQKIEQERDNLPSDHWLIKSLAEILMDNKTAAISSAQKAVEIAKQESEEKYKKAISHQGAIFMRYPKEGDSIVQTMLEYDSAFPEDKAVSKFNFEQHKDEIIEIFRQQRERVEKIKNQYLHEAVPTYALEKMLNKPFIEVWSQRGTSLPFFYMDPGTEFIDMLIGNLHTAKTLLFDYQSLLTLSKTKLLGLLNRLEGKQLLLHFETFNKIQEELVRYEHEDLRRLWDYIRENDDIEYIYRIELKDKNLKKLDKIFEDWLRQSIQYCYDEKATFVTDDVRLLKLVNTTSSSINSYAFIQEFKNLGWIDDKRLSQVKYELAGCAYTFLQFSADDLHEAVWQADYKFTVGNLHYLREMNLEGSDPVSFLGVFYEFVDKLWRSGALPEDKVTWLQAVCEQAQVYFERAVSLPTEAQDEKTIKDALSLFSELWVNAIKIGNKNDLQLLENKVSEILTLPIFESMQDLVKKLILKTIEDKKL